MKLQKRDFILVGLQPWDIQIGSNFKNIARELAKENRVLYINLPITLSTWLKNILSYSSPKRSFSDFHSPNLVEKNIYVYTPSNTSLSINKFSPGIIYDLLNKTNAKRYTLQINKIIQQLGFNNYILINDSLMFIGKYLKEYLNPDFYLYYIRDNLVEQPYFKKHGAKLEAETIKSADAVASNSDFLAEYARRYNSQSYMIGQGCDLESFNESQEEIKANPFFSDINAPVIGYVGNITSSRLNIKLLEEIAQKKSSWHFVLVGPEDLAFQKSVLHELPNVSFLGIKPMEELPGWIKGFDVCLNPQLVNSNTIGNYPRKVDEYLALGKPVVATNTLAMQYFKEHVYLGNNAEEYIGLIAKALSEDNKILKDKRKSFASKHSWKDNVDAIYNIIKNT